MKKTRTVSALSAGDLAIADFFQEVRGLLYLLDPIKDKGAVIKTFDKISEASRSFKCKDVAYANNFDQEFFNLINDLRTLWHNKPNDYSGQTAEIINNLNQIIQPEEKNFKRCLTGLRASLKIEIVNMEIVNKERLKKSKLKKEMGVVNGKE